MAVGPESESPTSIRNLSLKLLYDTCAPPSSEPFGAASSLDFHPGGNGATDYVPTRQTFRPLKAKTVVASGLPRHVLTILRQV